MLTQPAAVGLIARPVAGGDEGLVAALQAAGLPVDDLTEPGRAFFAFETCGEPVGYGGFEPTGVHVLLRSLAVLPPARHRGLGTGMLAWLLQRAFDEGAREAWLLTTTAAAFFERAGFRPAARETAPACILASRQASVLCPASAVLMTRTL